jgi:hypothetical protein
MMKTACAATLASLVLFGALPAAAQDRPVTTFVPEAQRRWDAAGFIGWRGVNKSAIAPEWNEWYDVATFNVSAGHYLTPHVKLDVDLSTTSEGSVYSQDFVTSPVAPPVVIARDHEFHRTTLAAIVAYQFFENQWVHPFLGIGLEGIREAEQVESLITSPIGPRSPLLNRESRVRYSARPVVTGGVKWYASERAFIRTDLLTSFSTEGVESTVWRFGVGVDF